MRLLFSNSLPKQIKVIVSDVLGRTGEGRGREEGKSDFQNSCHGRSRGDADPLKPASDPGGRVREPHLGGKLRLGVFIWALEKLSLSPRMSPRSRRQGVRKVREEGREDGHVQRGLNPRCRLKTCLRRRHGSPRLPGRGLPPRSHDLERSGEDSDPGLTQSLCVRRHIAPPLHFHKGRVPV